MKNTKLVNYHSYNTTKSNIFDVITEKMQDASKSTDIVVPHICNIDCNVTTNFYKKACEYYPTIHQFTLAENHNLGRCSILKVKKEHNNTLWFCQMFTDKTSKYKNINYMYLQNCLVELRRFCLTSIKKEYLNLEIHTIKFGTGISGGRWSTVSDLISDSLQGIPTFVHLG